MIIDSIEMLLEDVAIAIFGLMPLIAIAGAVSIVVIVVFYFVVGLWNLFNPKK